MTPFHLTVALPSRDRRDTLMGALDAVAPQLKQGDELIVVDDGSTDGTFGAAQKWLAANRAHGRILTEGRVGVSEARNIALRGAAAPVVCFLDDDVRPEPGWLGCLRQAWSHAHERTAAIGGPMQAEWLAPRPPWLADHLLYVVSVLDLGGSPLRLDQTPGRGYLWAGNLSIRVDAALAVGGFDPLRGARPSAPFDRGEEEELQRRLAAARWEVHYEPGAVVRHLVPAERLTPEFFVRVARERGLREAGRGRPRRDGAFALARSVAKRLVFGALRRPESTGASFASAHAWALLTGPRSPKPPARPL